MKTIKFFATMGVVEGYAHNNESTNALEIVSEVWQQKAKIIFEITGVYVSAVITDSRTVYNQDWGCPKGGEITAFITGEANPTFSSNLDVYKDSVIRVLRLVQKELRQVTTQVSFVESEFHYLK